MIITFKPMNYILLFIINSNAMKKNLLLCLVIVNGFISTAQVSQKFPAGFQKANVPESIKNCSVNIKSSQNKSINQIPFVSESLPRANSLMDSELIIGNTFYDHQTYNSISNQLCVNDDGTISAAWNFSPDAISVTTPPFPNRGSGYNYWNGTVWNYVAGPVSRQESVRTGYTNIVVTPVSELLIAHASIGPTDSNQIVVSHRSSHGNGSWTELYPWGHSLDVFPKACAAGSSGINNNVYVIFLSGGSDTMASVSHTINGQSGPIFFSRSTDGGLTWDPKNIIPLIDSNFYRGFNASNYSIDAKDSIVAIGFGNIFTDVGLLKSVDNGQTWTKTIIQQHPIPFYNGNLTDINNDGINDTIFSNTGDVKVLIDNGGTVHAWFSSMRYYADTINSVKQLPWTDGLEYWNESMGTNNYVEIAATQDFNGNGILDTPMTVPFGCTRILPWADYNGGMTIMPSAGIDANGKIYLAYAALDERTDLMLTDELRRHIFMMTLEPPYDPAFWTYPYDIIPSIASGGSGESQEGAFACVGRHVDNSYAYVMYQRDDAPGTIKSKNGTCSVLRNFGNSSDIVLAMVDAANVGLVTNNRNDLFVSQNYPNPTKGITYININLKRSMDLRLEVYDIIGKNVYSETKKQLVAGNHTISFNSANLEPGIYNYTVIAGGQKSSRKMIIQ